MPNFVAVNGSLHKDLKVKEDKTYAHVKSQHIVSLVVHEFSLAAQDYPIIFIKDEGADQYRAAALLGLKPGENLFYSDNAWKADYKPESILGYPFLVAPDKNKENTHILVMDEESDRLVKEDDKQAITKSLFEDDGKQGEFVTKVGNFLTDHLGKQQQTDAFIKKLLALKLIVNQSLEVTVAGKGKINIDGLHIINEDALNKLSDKDFKELRKLGYIGPIYASLFSMNRIGNLVRMAGAE